MDVASGPEKPDEVGLNPSSDMCNVMMGLQNELCKRSMGE